MFFETDLGQYVFLGFLFVMVTILTAWLIMIEKNRRVIEAKKKCASTGKRTQTRKSARANRAGDSANDYANGFANDSEGVNPKFVEPMSDWEFPENDGWEYSFPSGKFIDSWYLNMDVLEEGISELGSRYRILKDNDTGVIYFYDRSGMAPLVKDYRRMRYA